MKRCTCRAYIEHGVGQINATGCPQHDKARPQTWGKPIMGRPVSSIQWSNKPHGRRMKWPPPKVRRARAKRVANLNWIKPWSQLTQSEAVARAKSTWLDGYNSAMRDVQKRFGK
jgi:hypothetical protein